MSKSELYMKIARYWWQKAEESLRSAERELAAGSFSFAVNRLYYAVFYAASAVMMGCYGKSYKKHSGVRATFHREFVKKGLVEEDQGKLYDQLYDDRQEGDYALFVEFQKDYVEMQLKKCKDFLVKLRPLVRCLDSVQKDGAI